MWANIMHSDNQQYLPYVITIKCCKAREKQNAMGDVHAHAH